MRQHLRRADTHTLAQAVSLRAAGRFLDATAVLRSVLALEPHNAEALNLLGALALQTGQPASAVEPLSLAVRLSPRSVDARINLGHALKMLGQFGPAIASYQEAVRLKPRNAHARYALGNGLVAAGRTEPAEDELRAAVRLDPRFGAAHNNLGHVLRLLGRPAEAETAFRRALATDPTQLEWHLNLALALGEQQRTGETLSTLRAVLGMAPDNATALHAYGTLLVRAKRFEEAIPPLTRLRSVQRGVPDPFVGLAQALTALGRFDEALVIARDTVGQAPDSAGAHANLGAVLLSLGRLDEALEEYGAALQLDPGHALAKTGRAFARLRQGRLLEAWDDYEARLDAQRMATDQDPGLLVDRSRLQGKPWDGQPRHGRPLLVYPEQGLGDAMQMARYAAVLAADGPVHWVVVPALRRLIGSAPGMTSVPVPADDLPVHDFHCSVMSLPRLCRTSLATIPGGVPYLHADPAEAAAWRTRLAQQPGIKVGLAWQGNPDYLLDRVRSVPPALLAQLGGNPNVQFVSLQVPRPEAAPPVDMLDFAAELTDMAATAALVEALDLVISVDTSIAHLGGALGRPVWLLNRFNTDWRWMQDREDSPWYPTMRIFRQPAPGDWHSVLTDVRAALAEAGREGSPRAAA